MQMEGPRQQPAAPPYSNLISEPGGFSVTETSADPIVPTVCNVASTSMVVQSTIDSTVIR